MFQKRTTGNTRFRCSEKEIKRGNSMRRSQEECAHPTEWSTKKLECGEADVVRIFRSQSKRWENNVEEGRHKLAYGYASVFELILNCMFLGKDGRRQWQPTPVLLPGKSHGRRSLVGLQSMGSLRVRHDWATSLSLFTFMHWRRKWQPTPVFLPGESQGPGSLVGCHLGGRTESDTTEVT